MEELNPQEVITLNRKRWKEFRRLRRNLEFHHALFYKLFEMGEPCFSKEIPTSAVMFDLKQGRLVRFVWNPDFWDECDDYKRAFVTCHEILHVMLSHGKRMQGMDKLTPAGVNAALDIVVNHMLIESFGFSREHLQGEKDLCWIDTVFKEEEVKEIEEEREYEYYYGKILEMLEEMEKKGELKQGDSSGGGIGKYSDAIPGSLDEHGTLSSFDGEEVTDELVKKITEDLTQDERKEFHDLVSGNKNPGQKTKACQETSADQRAQNQLAGTVAGDSCYVVITKKPKYNMKWTEVIKMWRRKREELVEPDDVWHTRSRRHYLMEEELMLPHTKDDEDDGEEKEYIHVWFFQDTSGSCTSWADKFFNAAKTFPPSKFKVRPFCFDTKVYETSLETGELFGFGGTSFQPIENEIQRLIQKEDNTKYPDAVFVFTDGYGSGITPEKPDKWYWFLTEGGSKDYIPSESHVYKLDDFLK
jgi:predicted metal-dependent peptidase